MADDLSLLFRIRGDASSAKAATAETRAAVRQLAQSLGPDLSKTVSGTNAVVGELGEKLTDFVGQRLPLVGGAFVRVTGNLRGLNDELRRGGPQTAALSKQIDSIAKSSGKSSTEVARFLSTFVRLEGAAARNDAAFKLFGGTTDLIGNKTARFIPELEKAGVALAGAATESAAAGAALKGLPLPIALVTAALIGMGAATIKVSSELFTLTKNAADFQGKMFDLAQQTGVEVETLSALEIIAKRTGGSIDNMAQSLVAFQRNIADAQDPVSKAAELFRKFNIDVDDTETALRQTFRALAAMPVGFQQTNAAAELFGARGGKQILALLKETNGDLDKLIQEAREAGILITTDAARAADVFNDQLELLNFQLRASSAAAAEDLIPAFVGALEATTDLVRAGKPLLDLFSAIAGPTVRAASSTIKGFSLAVAALTFNYKELKKAIEEANEPLFKGVNAQGVPTVKVPDVSPTPLPGLPTPREAAQQAVQVADAVVAASKRAAASINQALSESFEKGRIDRQQQAEDTIAANERVFKAEKDRIDKLIGLKQQEAKTLDRGTEAYRKVVEEVNKLQQQQLDAENLFNVTSRELRAKAAQDRADSLRRQEQNNTDILLKEYDRQIRATEAAIQRGAQAESDGLTIIEQLEQAKIEARREGLERQLQIGSLSVAAQRDLNNQLIALGQEADILLDEQRERRFQREREAAERVKEAVLARVAALLEVDRISDEARITALTSLASLRVRTEEQVAREILGIRLAAIDREDEAARAAARSALEAPIKALQQARGKLNAELQAVASIEDPQKRLEEGVRLNKALQQNVDAEILLQQQANKDREKLDADLENQIRVNHARRKAALEEGNREIEEARQRDLDNERRYTDELQRIRDRTEDIERDAAEEVIRLMRLHFARRRDIIRAQRDLDLADEAARHQRVTDSLNEQKREVDARIALLEKHLERLKIGTTAEIEEHDRLIRSLEALKQKRLELQRQQEAEDRRNQTRKRRVTKESEDEEKEADPFERIKTGIEDIKKFSRELEDSIVPLGEILAGTFNQVADAIGQTVANYVLLGETGPAVMRKILAQALASIAAEAAVNAIKELALGFATLFFNPAESAGHFAAAGLWASIAGGSAIAGRAIAGDLFKQKNTETGGSRGGSSSSRDEARTIDLIRNQQPIITVILRGEPGPGFQNAVINGVVDSVRSNGPVRTIIQNVAEGSG